MLNAFCRVAPSDRFNFLAILPAGVFLRAIVLSSRTSLEVHARRFFDFFAIKPPFQERQLVSLMGTKEKTTDGMEMIQPSPQLISRRHNFGYSYRRGYGMAS